MDVAFALFLCLLVIGVVVSISFYYWIVDIQKDVETLKKQLKQQK